MNETYLVMAKTVEEAIAVANREYAHDGKEISYEILEMPKKGFLGIGARDAKIKVTVTESASSQLNAELNSLVADLRGMKVHTNRGGSEADERPRKQNPGQGQGQKKSQNGSQNQGQERPQNQGQGQRKTEARPTKPQEPKPQEPKRAGAEAEKPQDARPAGTQGSKKEPRHEGQPKPESRPQKQERPAAERPAAERPAAERPAAERPVPERPVPERPVKAEKPERQTEHPVREPKEAKERKEVREPKLAEKKAADGKPAEPKPAEKAPVRTEPAEELPAAPAVPVQEPQAEAAKPEYRSSLRNQAKPQRRPSRPKSQNADAASEQAEAIIASPVGLSDFTREAAHEEGFGSGAGASGGRMSNDIRRRPRQQQPKPAEKTAAPVPAEAAEATEAVEAMEAAAAVEAMEAAEFVETPEDAEEAASEASEASEAPVVDEDRQKVGVTEAEMQYALDFANTLLRNMAIEAEAKAAACPEGEEYVIEGDANVYPKIDIDGSGTGILIGHHGETLDAVQYLVNLAALRQSRQKGGDYVKIVVDIENYRAKREETLRALARRMAARAVKYKRNVFLEPMNAYERRIIHSELHNFENVSTHSVGTDKNRKIIITYEGPDKVQQPRRERTERQERPEHAERPERADKPEGKSDAKGSASRRSEPRRPKKIQKMPIEKLPDFLASGTTPEDADTFIEIED